MENEIDALKNYTKNFDFQGEKIPMSLVEELDLIIKHKMQ